MRVIPTGRGGAKGANGTNGTNGKGVPIGGDIYQVLVKQSATNFDTAWEDLVTIQTEPPAGPYQTQIVVDNSLGTGGLYVWDPVGETYVQASNI